MIKNCILSKFLINTNNLVGSKCPTKLLNHSYHKSIHKSTGKPKWPTRVRLDDTDKYPWLKQWFNVDDISNDSVKKEYPVIKDYAYIYKNQKDVSSNVFQFVRERYVFQHLLQTPHSRIQSFVLVFFCLFYFELSSSLLQQNTESKTHFCKTWRK